MNSHEIETIFWYAVVVLLFFGGSAAAFIEHLISRRHRFKLSIQKEKTKQEQAKAKMLEEQNRKVALGLRQAELEIEKFDRRIPGASPIPRLPSGVDPEDL